METTIPFYRGYTSEYDPFREYIEEDAIAVEPILNHRGEEVGTAYTLTEEAMDFYRVCLERSEA